MRCQVTLAPTAPPRYLIKELLRASGTAKDTHPHVLPVMPFFLISQDGSRAVCSGETALVAKDS